MLWRQIDFEEKSDNETEQDFEKCDNYNSIGKYIMTDTN